MRAGPGDWIAVDWGTTNMRAALVSVDGAVRARAPRGPGMGPLAREADRAAAYEAALLAAVGGWLADDAIDVLVCGMAGARQGWLEAPYRDVPTQLVGLLAAAVSPPLADPRLAVRIVPGLCVRRARPDVMRGEETQLLGLLRTVGGVARAVLPGTHSKWVDLDGDRVTGFRTHMTGELNALLAAHSVLGSDLAGDAFDEGAFDAALALALDEGGAVLHRLFAIRARGLLEGADPARARATLSGLLIGAEIARETAPKAAGQAAGQAAADRSPVHLVGGGELTALYARALAARGVASTVHDGGELAVAGLAAMRQSET